VLCAALVLAIVGFIISSPGRAGAAAPSGPTTSYYESSADPSALYAQGQQAGLAGEQGLVILDFGRPANDGSGGGMDDYSGTFDSFASIEAAVQSFINAYYFYAPNYTTLDVAIGTNNSCGSGQPCGGGICGCPDEPPSYWTWGSEFASLVLSTNNWSASFRAQNGYTDVVRVDAGDDAEPAFDPGYYNTYDALAGYAQTVGGSYPPLIDFGSADPNFWTESQLLQIAYGFQPDVPMPEVYYANQAAEWADLLRYARQEHGNSVTIFGVLSSGGNSNDPQTAYTEMVQAAAGVTGQQSIDWSSNIG
jgi:hypothetical protein